MVAEPTAWSLGSAWAGVVLVLLLTAVVPGLAWWKWVRTSQSGPTTASVGGGVAVGITVAVLTGEFLVRIQQLHQAVVWACAFVVAALGGTAVLTAVTMTVIRTTRSRPIGREPTQHGARRLPRIAAFILAALATSPQLAIIAWRPGALVSPTAWYYWATARSLAIHGGVAPSVHEWGEAIPAFTFHYGFSAFTALLAVASGGPDVLVAAQCVRILTVVLYAIGVWVLMRAWGATPLQAAAAVLVANALAIYAIKLSSLRPEALAYGLALLTVGLLVDGIRHARVSSLAASAIGAVGVNQLHQLTAVLALSALTGVAVAHVLGLFDGTPVRVTKRLRTLGGYAASALAATLLANLALTGAWSEGDAVAGLPTVDDGVDPTWRFAQLVSSQRGIEATAGTHPPTVGQMTRDSLTAHFSGTPGWLFVVVAILGVLGCVLFMRRDRRARALVVFAVVGFLSLLLSAWALSMTGATYVPRRTGFSRVLQLWPILPAVLVCAVPSLVRRPRARTVVVSLLTAGALALASLAAPTILHLRNAEPTSRDIDTLASLPVDDGAEILTNAFTQGYVGLYTPATGLLDGHAPYLERDLLARSNQILEQTRNYFKNPVRAPFPFDEYDVRYVLAAKQPYALGTSANFYPDRAVRLKQDPRLRLILETRRLVLYQVLPRA